MHFIDTDVPVYVHDLELTNALWCLFTKVGLLEQNQDPELRTMFTDLFLPLGRRGSIPALVPDSPAQLADLPRSSY